MPYYIEPYKPLTEGDLRLRWSNIANTMTTFAVAYCGLVCTGGWVPTRMKFLIAGVVAYNQFMCDPDNRGWAEDCIDHGMLINPDPYCDPNRNPRAVMLDPTNSNARAGAPRDR
uniref:Uncharacterized protein n=1 Tax=Neobodo designis TaxID=312471 RepID=A0A7S1QFV9_NEODS|mmetsp:Transcript_45137/g.139255  ORF Transcript_45137/g.139255 Transcript_45137/m.139255 type:complete len:114 (+) Transcript_45137:53-394(+)